MKSYDVIVVGGGLLGCFALRSLARYRVKAALFECREDLCTGISRANTAIVYSGCDTKPGTVKTELCVRSARNFESLCDELGVRYVRCGSIMVSSGPRGDGVLRKKYEQGLLNGVRDLKLLDGAEVLQMEPQLNPNVTMGLLAPDAGTVNPWELCLASAENALANGMELFLNTEVVGISPVSGGYVVKTGKTEYFTRGIINCAGLKADAVYEMVMKPAVRVTPTAGDYMILDTKASGAIHHIIFQEPEVPGKGLTLVPTVDRNILIGPTEREVEEEAFATSKDGVEQLYSLIGEVIPALPTKHLIRTFAAMRPNPFWVTQNESGEYRNDAKSIKDFCILSPEESPGFISLIGIKTPGLTCAHELGLRVSDRMAEVLGLAKNSGFDPRREKPHRVSELTNEQRAALINENPAYGRILCRCREISEGEIMAAAQGPICASTVDGVKRRTGATGGRCQGSFCTQRIIELLALQTGRAPAEIQKDGPGSHILFGGPDERI